jgi:hypothetical protein
MPAASARRLVIPAALLAAALVSCHTFPTDPNATRWDPPPSQFPITYVSGRVFRQGTTTPVPGAVVSAGSSISVTDAAGNYALDGIRSSQTLLIAAKEGYDTLRLSLGLNGSNQTYNVFLRPQQ